MSQTGPESREVADVGLGRAGGPLRIRVLGPFQIDGLDLRAIRSRKARTTLKLLALGRGRPVSLDRLIDGLWPTGGGPPQPEREVSVNVSRVRRLIGRDRIERTDAGYRLHMDWLDLDRLDEVLVEAHRRAGLGDHVATRTLASAGLELVNGPLLADEAETEWLEVERAAVSRAVAELRELAAEAALGVGQWGEAAHQAEAALTDDPYDEAAVRIVMAARLGAGRPGSALATYAQMRGRLAEDLGASPSPETEALHLAVLQACDQEADPAGGRGGSADPGVAAAATDQASSRPRWPDHLPGRDDALDQLRAASDEVRRTGRLELVVVEGEAGGGKSRLLDTFRTIVVRDGGVVLSGQGDELGRVLPLQPVADALTDHLRAAGDESVDAILADDRRLLAPVLGLATPTSLPVLPGPGMDGEAMESLMFGALLRALGRLARTQVTVLLIDDLHLAGDSTRAWLRFATRRPQDAALLVVVSQRPGELPGSTAFTATASSARIRRVRLSPLDLEAAREVVGPDRAEGLLERSGGNPLLLVELAAHGAGPLPGSLREAVAAQVDRAGPDVVATLRTAAVLGPEIDLDLLSEVSGRAPIELLAHLEDATARQLLAEQGSRFVFRHALVREAVVAGTSAARQALIHRQAAEALAARPGHDPLALARHAQLAGDDATAARALAEAATQATGGHDLAAAEQLLSRAIELHDSAELRLQRGHLRVALSNLDGGEADAEAASALGRRAEGVALRAWIARHRHDLVAAIRLGRQGAVLAADPTTRASCLVAVALAERGRGDLPAADEHLTEAMAERGSADLGLSGWMGVLRVHQGRTEEALDLLEPAVGAEIDTVHGFWVEHVLQMAAHANALAGRPDRALTLIDRWTSEMTKRASHTRYQGSDDNYRAWILGNLGQPEAAELTARAIEESAMPEIEAQARLDEAGRLEAVGDLDAARAAVDRAEAVWSRGAFYNQWRCQARAGLIRGRIHLATGDPAAALRFASAVVAESDARREQRYATLGRLLVARCQRRLPAGRDAGNESEPPRPDLDEVTRDLERLGHVAGIEAWWMTAEVAADLDQDRWWTLAEQRVIDLAAHTGERRPAFEGAARDRLDRLRIRPAGR